MKLTAWFDYLLLGNSLVHWAAAAGLLLVAWALLIGVRRVIKKRIQVLAEHTQASAVQTAESVVQRTKTWFLLLVSLYFASSMLSLTPSINSNLNRVVVLALLVQMGLWTVTGLSRTLELRRERQFAEDPGGVAAIDVMGFIVRVTVWAIVFLLVLDNLGVNITALVAGLGVGGIAVALAAQNILGDLFASLSIVLDKPFAVGDFLIIGDFMGTVEKVGLKTTRVRSLSGEEVIFSNTDLLNSRIRNYGRMFERRVVFSLGVTYQTPADKLKCIPGMIREIIEAHDNVRFDRAHFQKYGDFALLFETVYYVTSSDYALYMDVQQSINLQIYECFETEGIDFAYPTQTVYVGQGGPEASSA